MSLSLFFPFFLLSLLYLLSSFSVHSFFTFAYVVSSLVVVRFVADSNSRGLELSHVRWNARDWIQDRCVVLPCLDDYWLLRFAQSVGRNSCRRFHDANGLLLFHRRDFDSQKPFLSLFVFKFGLIISSNHFNQPVSLNN